MPFPTSPAGRVPSTLHARMLTRMLKLRDGEGVHPSYGICLNVGVCTEYDGENQSVHQWLQDAAKTWPKYSGSRAYPVPCPQGGNPEQAFDAAWMPTSARSGPVLWDKSTPYGALRYELLDFFIAKLTAELADA